MIGVCLIKMFESSSEEYYHTYRERSDLDRSNDVRTFVI